MEFVDKIKQKAKSNIKTIVLPEAYEERNLKAADRIISEGFAALILIGNPDQIHHLASELYLENIGKQSAEQGSRNYARTVLNTVRALRLFRGDYIAFRDVDKEFLSEFTDYLRQMPKASKYGVLKTGGRLSNNSVVSYYGTLRTASTVLTRRGSSPSIRPKSSISQVKCGRNRADVST